MDKKDKPVVIWLLIGCILITSMVIVGGITRLTDSGLSIVDWKPIMGALPPMNQNEWQQKFDLYKTIPEYEEVNSNFKLEDFKKIFWWEFIHRNLGRFIGLVFIIPFTIFIFQGRIKGKLLKKTIIILILGGFQAVLGWYMVRSGLDVRVDVSQYRLAAHLITALLAFSYTFWVALELIYKNKVLEREPLKNTWIKVLLAISTLQIFYGAMVAGLKAGLINPYFPKMTETDWISAGVAWGVENQGFLALFENRDVVQLIHRYLGITLFILIFVMFTNLRKKTPEALYKNKGIYILTQFIFIQFLLGIFTLLFSVPIWLGILHQLGAVFVLGSLVYNLFISAGNSK